MLKERAKEIGVPQRRIGEIVMGKRAVTVDTGLRLARYFGMNDNFQVGLQIDYDTAIAKVALIDVLAQIKSHRQAASLFHNRSKLAPHQASQKIL